MGKVMNVIHFVDYDGGEVGGIKNLKKIVNIRRVVIINLILP